MALALSLLPLRLPWALAECCARVGTDAGLSIEFCLNWGAGASPGVSGDKGLGLGFGTSAGVVVRPADSAGADIDAIDAAVDVECTVAAPALADADAEVARAVARGGGTAPLTAVRARSLPAPIAAVVCPLPVVTLAPPISRRG